MTELIGALTLGAIYRRGTDGPAEAREPPDFRRTDWMEKLRVNSGRGPDANARGENQLGCEADGFLVTLAWAPGEDSRLVLRWNGGDLGQPEVDVTPERAVALLKGLRSFRRKVGEYDDGLRARGWPLPPDELPFSSPAQVSSFIREHREVFDAQFALSGWTAGMYELAVKDVRNVRRLMGSLEKRLRVEARRASPERRDVFQASPVPAAAAAEASRAATPPVEERAEPADEASVVAEAVSGG